MGRLGVSSPALRLAVLLALTGAAMIILGVYMAAGPWWACVAVGVLVAVYAVCLFDVSPAPASPVPGDVTRVGR